MNEQQANDLWIAAVTYNQRAGLRRPSPLRRAVAWGVGSLALAMALALVLATRSLLLLIALVASGAAAHAAATCSHNGDLPGAHRAAVGPAGLVLGMTYCAFVDQCLNGVTAEPYYVCGNASLGVPVVAAFLVFVGAYVRGGWLAPAAQRAHPTVVGRGAVALGIALSLLGARATQRALLAPGRDAWVEAQPLVATTAAATTPGASSSRVVVPGACIERRCEGAFASCTLHVVQRCDTLSAKPRGERSIVVSREGALRVRRARDGTLLVQEWSEGPRGGVHALGRPHAYTRDTLAPTTLTTAMLAPQLAAPRGWIVGGLLAGVFATVLGALSLRRRRWDAPGWASAIHDGDGALTVAGERLRHPRAARFTRGALWVRVADAMAAPYRSAASRVVLEVSPVSPAAMRARATLLATLGVAGALCLSAPLLTAALIGLV